MKKKETKGKQRWGELGAAWIAKEKAEVRQKALLAKKKKDNQEKKPLRGKGNIKSLCCTPETNIMLYVKYIRKEKGSKNFKVHGRPVITFLMMR